jgi:hypothetical protein
MINGLYRTRDRLLGNSVRVQWSAGDAAPVLSESVYRAMGGVPDIALLPTREDYARSREAPPLDPLEMT